MGYQRGDNRYGDRWRDEDRYGRGRGRGGYERERGIRDDDDRGFFERASDEVRSWFRDDEEDDDRRGRRYERDWGGYRPAYSHRERIREFGSDRDYGNRADPTSGAYGAGYGTTGELSGSRASRSGDIHDPNYRQWRDRQIADLDRDYDEYRREHQSKFDQEFASWREKRQSQRQLVGRVTEHMEVVGSDGAQVGKVDKVRGDRILLAKSDKDAGGHHHSIPCSWVEQVDKKVTLNKSAEQAQQAWRDEENRRALFEGDDARGEGPHILNRSFSGTY